MNSKTLKKLRKSARELAQLLGLPARLHVTGLSNARMVPDYSEVLQDGTLNQRPFFYTGTVKNSPESERGFYRRLKARPDLA